ncbi:putative NagC-like transcriptional regulator [Klebsiella pneumoniae]|nr:putative NagC-like transcriptional regulator [Klebsiella pneumoniae]
MSNILAELLSEGLIGHSTEHLSKRGVNSGSYQIPEHGAWTLCMNITPTSIEYQLADARLWQWMAISICRSTRPLLRPA